MTVKTTLRMDEELDEKLEYWSSELGSPKAVLIRLCCTRYLQKLDREG